MRLLGAADESHGGESIAPFVERTMCRSNDFGMVGQAKVVVRTEVEHIAPSRRRDMALLMRRDHALGLERACGADFGKLPREMFFIAAEHVDSMQGGVERGYTTR